VSADVVTGRKSQGAQAPFPPISLRCYVYRRSESSWLAQCVDLDLLSEAGTLEAAVSGLRDSMAGYLTTAFEGDMSRLVPRPSPAWHRIRYHLFSLRAALTSNRRDFRIMDCSADQLPLCA
jgi:hypothetical protein